jgi:predicted transcriptional regulator
MGDDFPTGYSLLQRFKAIRALMSAPSRELRQLLDQTEDEVMAVCEYAEVVGREMPAFHAALETVDRELGPHIHLDDGESPTPWVDRAYCAAAGVLGKLG